MFARHGIQNALRTRRRSVAFLLLMTLLVTLLGTSLGLSFALQETLRQCRENYSTIGLVEYLGPGYPSTARVVEDAGEVLEEFESKLDRSDPALVDWEPTRVALGYTPALESLTDYSVLENRFALVIRLTEQATRRIKGQDPDFYPLLDPDGQLVWQWGTGTPDREVKLPYYYANVVETLFSSQRLAANQPVLLDVQEGSSADLSQDYNMPSDTIWKARHYYLVQGVYTENELLGPSYKQLSPAPYQVNGVSLSQVSAIDITRPDGSCAQLDGSTDIEAVGQTFQVTSHSLTAQATDRPADLLPFQQDELTLVQGDYYAAGSKGCLISQTLADDLGLDVGGSLPLSLAVREDTLVLALVSCLVFSVVSLERRHKRRRTRRTAQGARSRSLKGGGLTYARLSARRGGFRSLVPVLAGICAAVLFCQLTGTVTRYDQQLTKLRSDSSVRGFLTDIRGQSTSGLALGDGVVEGISQIPGVADVTYLTTASYYFNGFYRDGKFAGGPGQREQPIGSFAAERYEDELRSGPKLVFTNSLKGAPEFLSRTSVEVEWLEGYDEGFLAADPTLEIDPNTGHIVKDKPPENRCLIPTDMMDEYGIRLGDWIWLEAITYPYTNSNDTQIIQVAFRVVGAFVQTGRANNIYANLDMPKYFLDLSMASVYEWSTQDLPGGTILTRGGICMRQAYSGATFSIPSCTDLTSVKQALHDMGLSEVGRISSIRNFVIINDAAYLTTERAAAQRLWYMQHLFPVVYAIALGLAYLLAFLQVQSRRRELRTMRSVGADRKTAYGSLFLEQLMLAALGAVLGAGLCLVLGWGSRLGLGLTAAFAVLWLLGAHVALCRANSRHILKNRREVE